MTASHRGPAEPLQDGGREQEVTDGLSLALEDLLGQVVDDVAVVTGEAGNEPGHVLPPLNGQGRQLERRDPPLRAPLQRGDVVWRQGQTHHVVEVDGNLVGGEAQVRGANLDEFAPST
jgi:hypothetical protein